MDISNIIKHTFEAKVLCVC